MWRHLEASPLFSAARTDDLVALWDMIDVVHNDARVMEGRRSAHTFGCTDVDLPSWRRPIM
jgi:hypothetical protein